MPKLNQNEAPEGYVALDAGSDNACLACDLNSPRKCRSDMCTQYDRKDGHSVIFKRKPTKPVRKPREWMAWAVVLRNKKDNEPYIIFTRHDARLKSGDCNVGRITPFTKVIRVKITEVI